MFVNPGIKEVYFSAADTLDSGYSGVYGMGYRQPAEMEISAFNEIVDKNNLPFKNLLNIKLDSPTMQIDNVGILGAAINAAKRSQASVAMVSAGVAKVSGNVQSEHGGIYLFENDAVNNALGIDFELNFTLSERTARFTFERAFVHGDANAGQSHHANGVLKSAGTNVLPFLANRLPHLVAADVIDGFVNPTGLIPSGITSGSAVFADSNLEDYSVNIKTKGTKNGFNKTIVTGFEVLISMTCSGPDFTAVHEIMDHELRTTSITLDLGSVNLVFNGYGLARKGTVIIGDDNRTGKFEYSGTYDSEFVVVSSDITFNAMLT